MPFVLVYWFCLTFHLFVLSKIVLHYIAFGMYSITVSGLKLCAKSVILKEMEESVRVVPKPIMLCHIGLQNSQNTFSGP